MFRLPRDSLCITITFYAYSTPGKGRTFSLGKHLNNVNWHRGGTRAMEIGFSISTVSISMGHTYTPIEACTKKSTSFGAESIHGGQGEADCPLWAESIVWRRKELFKAK